MSTICEISRRCLGFSLGLQGDIYSDRLFASDHLPQGFVSLLTACREETNTDLPYRFPPLPFGEHNYLTALSQAMTTSIPGLHPTSTKHLWTLDSNVSNFCPAAVHTICMLPFGQFTN